MPSTFRMRSSNGANELWSVRIAGGTPVRLSDILVSGQSVKFAISPDSDRVVYLVDQDTPGIPELFSVPIAGGSSTKLNMELAGLPGQVRDFLISPTSERVYYAADGAVNNRDRALAGRHRRRGLDPTERGDRQRLRHLRICRRADRGRLGAGGLSRRPIDRGRPRAVERPRRPARRPAIRISRGMVERWCRRRVLPDQPERQPGALPGRRDGQRLVRSV